MAEFSRALTGPISPVVELPIDQVGALQLTKERAMKHSDSGLRFIATSRLRSWCLRGELNAYLLRTYGTSRQPGLKHREALMICIRPGPVLSTVYCRERAMNSAVSPSADVPQYSEVSRPQNSKPIRR